MPDINEIKTIEKIMKLIMNLSDESQKRVIDYLYACFPKEQQP